MQRVSSEGESGLLEDSHLVFGLLLVVLVIAAALLRFYRLDAQSFWNDEGNSARIAERPLGLIVEGAAGDIHPPGYYLLLHGWRGLFGPSESSLRALSGVAGLVLVIFTCLLGCRLLGRPTGLIAAALSAVSPFAVYYSQEARMYALLGALSAASTYIALCTWDRLDSASPDGINASGLSSVVLYALVNVAGLYTHYAFVFVLVAHNVVFGLRWIEGVLHSGSQRRELLAWLGAQVGVCLLYLPWLPAALNAAGRSSAGGEYKLGLAFLDVLRVLVVGTTQPAGEAQVAMAAALGLLGTGLLSPATGQRRMRKERSGWRGPASLAIYVAVPLGFFFGLDLYKPAWLKFLVVLLAPFHVLVASGVLNIASVVASVSGFKRSRRQAIHAFIIGVGIVALSGLVYPSLHNLYFDEAYARDDYRQIAADIRNVRQRRDAIVLNAPNQWEVFTYYYPDRDVYPAPYHPGPGKASAFLDPLLDDYERLFVLYWGDAESDPRKRLESWLADHAYKTDDRWYGDVRLAMYRAADLPQEPDTTVDARFGEQIALRGYSLADNHIAAGDVIALTLFWEALGDIEEPYKVSVQMLDLEGRLVSQMDTVPGDGLAPTTSWRRGDTLIDRYGVLAPEGTSSGRHRLIVTVYHQADGERLPVRRGSGATGDSVVLQDLVIGPER